MSTPPGKAHPPPTPTTTNFFFKAKPKKLISNIKRALETADSQKEPEVAVAVAIEEKTPSTPTELIEVVEIKDAVEIPEKPIIKQPKRSKTLAGDVVNVKKELDDIDILLKSEPKPLKTAPSTPINIMLYDEFPYFNGDTNRHTYQYPYLTDQPLWNLYLHHCQGRKINPHTIILTHNNVKIFGSTTPASLGVGEGELEIYAYYKTDFRKKEEERLKKRSLMFRSLESEQSTEMEPELAVSPQTNAKSETINLRFKSKNVSDPIEFSILPDEPLSSILGNLQSSLSITPGTKIQIIFDGSAVDTTKSPHQLQLEDDDLLEVTY